MFVPFINRVYDFLLKNLIFPVLYSKFVVEVIMSRKVFFYSMLMAALLVSGLGGCVAKKVVDTADDSKGNAGKLAEDAKNAPNWEGVYTGIVPASNTEGVELRITLNSNETFEAQYQFVGKPETRLISAGRFLWNDAGDVVKLDIEHIPPYYAVAENILTQLDTNGNIISGSLADKYVLKKVQ
jgi:uncharacterized lipoprotein NlpE involved in copper resistance